MREKTQEKKKVQKVLQKRGERPCREKTKISRSWKKKNLENPDFGPAGGRHRGLMLADKEKPNLEPSTLKGFREKKLLSQAA